MERLTSREPRIGGMPGVCCTHFEGGDCQAIQGHCADGCAWEEAAWERLAAYEDTGLEPEEVSEYQHLCDSYAETGLDSKFVQFCIDATQNGLSMNRIRELAQAEKDGRLVVLPDAKYTDADGEKALQTAMWTCGNTNNPVTRYTADAIAEKLCREARDKNPPLTLEELQGMDGEPVWVVPLNDFEILPANYLVNAYAEQIVVDKFGAYLDFEDYGKTWLAYRRKPGEESG